MKVWRILTLTMVLRDYRRAARCGIHELVSTGGSGRSVVPGATDGSGTGPCPVLQLASEGQAPHPRRR